LQTEQIHELVTRERWPDAAAALSKMPRSAVADFIAELPDLPQQRIFGLLPVETAAAVLTHFPYYMQYVLLHTRTPGDMRAILDEVPPDERMQLFDELP